MSARTLELMLHFADGDAGLVVVREQAVHRARTYNVDLPRPYRMPAMHLWRWVHMIRGISHLPVSDFPNMAMRASPRPRLKLINCGGAT